MTEKIIQYILEDTNFTDKKHLENTVKLMTEGATIPFLARYRKEVTNNLDEEQLRQVQGKLEYYTELEKRKLTIIQTITELGKLTDDLNKQIVNCKDKTILEDLYLPYKPKKRTRATIAKEKGLEPLADIIIKQDINTGDKKVHLTPFVDLEKGVKNEEEALAGSLDIIAENISDDAYIRSWIRNYTFSKGILQSRVKKEFEQQKTKFEMYYNFDEPVKNIPSHRMLAIRRGITEKVLQSSITVDTDALIDFIRQVIIGKKKSIFTSDIQDATKDSYQRLIAPSIENEILNLKKDEADEEAIKVFAKNLHSLLLASPAGFKITMGIDPGFRTGCKVVVVDNTGKFLEYKAIFPHPPQNDVDKASKIILDMLNKYKVELISIGNGTASRETDLFLSKVIKDNKLDVIKVIVNEAGASIYSASELAKVEFPDLDVTVRGAISIARRLQDPLAELVKIDPKSIGVGQYQHDVNQTRLKKSLQDVVESCVNFVGVELNSASAELLSYVSGIGPTLAKNIIEYRNTNKMFKTRKELLKVTKLGPKAFEQCAGFLRLRNSTNPLDNSSVHPESYHVVEKMAKTLNVGLDKLISNKDLLSKIKANDFVDDKAGILTINDILKELHKPGRDPREEFKTAKLNDEITEITDLKSGMLLEGTVTNVTNFGAFVDIGVHQDGLVHISELSHSFVKDPNEIVKPGQVVKIKVISADPQSKRISLSMKL